MFKFTYKTNQFVVIKRFVDTRQIRFLNVQLLSFLKNKFIYLFIYGCFGSSLLCAGFL